MIPAVQLSAARTQMARMLTDTCTHYSKTTGVDESFAETSGFEETGTELPCLIYSAQARGISSEIKDVGETTADVGAYVFRFAWDTNVSVGDKLVAGTDEYLVTSNANSDTNRFILQVSAQRIRGDKF